MKQTWWMQFNIYRTCSVSLWTGSDRVYPFTSRLLHSHNETNLVNAIQYLYMYISHLQSPRRIDNRTKTTKSKNACLFFIENAPMDARTCYSSIFNWGQMFPDRIQDLGCFCIVPTSCHINVIRYVTPGVKCNLLKDLNRIWIYENGLYFSIIPPYYKSTRLRLKSYINFTEPKFCLSLFIPALACTSVQTHMCIYHNKVLKQSQNAISTRLYMPMNHKYTWHVNVNCGIGIVFRDQNVLTCQYTVEHRKCMMHCHLQNMIGSNRLSPSQFQMNYLSKIGPSYPKTVGGEGFFHCDSVILVAKSNPINKIANTVSGSDIRSAFVVPVMCVLFYIAPRFNQTWLYYTNTPALFDKLLL